MTELDYSKLGLKVGLEIHQQLNTNKRLFCDCSTTLDEKHHGTLQRYLRPSFSEIGEIDTAALFEWQKGKKYLYQIPFNSCLVEADEEPPHGLNREALAVVLAVAMSLESNIVDEIYVMRKIVIDGSDTTGFQRTSIVAMGGQVIVEGKKIGIQTIALEEDAARKISESANETMYSLDRLGIPLIEISTAPDITTPEEAEKVAFRIGQLLRLTGKVKRGIGTIRQDLNVSIQGGVKTEIKGVQRLELIPEIIKNEARRQYELLKIKDELVNKRGLSKTIVENEIKELELTHLFRNTNSKIIKKELEKGGLIYGIKFKGFKGIFGRELMPNRRFGTEIADYVRALAELGGIFHSDELPNYGITSEEVESVKKELGIGENDGFVLVIGDKEKLKVAITKIKERVLYAFVGVPKETRVALDDGTTKFMRPQPGSARMYPETDIIPIKIDESILNFAKSFVPENPETKLRKLIEMGLSKELATEILNSPRLDLFEELSKKYSPKVSPIVIATTLENYIKYAKSKGGDISVITDEVIEEIINALYNDKISKDSIQEILVDYSTSKKPIRNIVDNYAKITDEELNRIIDKILDENKDIINQKGEKAFNVIIGKVMNVVKGRAEGKKVVDTLKLKMKNYPRT
ncbi:Glu-tRNA(Gln) amidotransferase subunit GatE [Sulfolobus acidocaldarius]|uniref:Glu-tRNA(Gln) amidotransferase subunit GatE n=1 Tax=Sulfolobus acidocaldarius TaxID=2285 RepID=UPI0011BE58C0|nr:Glu-tRNA(Gln) amidotransferase subunit GatE [Sulfolobus acidocaldarius]